MHRLLFVAALAACTTTPRPLRDPPTHAPLPQLDWEAAGRESAQILSAYLQVDTVNPPGNETRGAEFLAAILQREGIDSEILEYAPGRGSLIARLKGSGKEKPICLLSHVDVVGFEAGDWKHPPLSGHIDADGVVWGRGALDMKGLGVVELMTLVWLKRLGVPLTRDVVLVAVADEEVDNGGARFLVEQQWDKLGCSHLVNEGGIGVTTPLVPGKTLYAISVAEKGLLWLRMKAKGASGHGSTPMPGRAPERLLRAIEKIRQRPQQPSLHGSLYQMLGEVGHARGGTMGFVLKRPFWVRNLAVSELLKEPAAKAAITNTVQVTGFSGGEQPNVVPSEVTATLDCRLLPGTTPAQMLAELKKIVDDPEITFEVLHQSDANESPVDDPLYHALARHAVAGRSDALAGPVLSVGYTDSLVFRPKGVHAYGFAPFAITPEEGATMHGANERVSTANLRDGLRILLHAVVEVATE
jgi:acetylornithine deacetylase/succinyl-diaminopimelate desuccinylase-like protein